MCYSAEHQLVLEQRSEPYDDPKYGEKQDRCEHRTAKSLYLLHECAFFLTHTFSPLLMIAVWIDQLFPARMLHVYTTKIRMIRQYFSCIMFNFTHSGCFHSPCDSSHPPRLYPVAHSKVFDRDAIQPCSANIMILCPQMTVPWLVRQVYARFAYLLDICTSTPYVRTYLHSERSNVKCISISLLRDTNARSRLSDI